MPKNNYSDFHKCKTLQRSIVFLDKGICTAYVIVCGMPMIHALITSFSHPSAESLLILFDAGFLKAVEFTIALHAISNKNFVFAVASVAAPLINVLGAEGVKSFLGQYYPLYFAEGTVLYDITLLFVSVPIFFLILFSIRKTEYLKEQPGYPYFNDLIENQKADRRQFDIKNEFQQTYERYTKNSSDSMTEVGETVSADTGKDDQNSSAQMDDVHF